MHRLMILLALLLLLPSLIIAEEAQEAEAPLTLRTATTEEEVKQFLLLPPRYSMSNVQRGYIRYIAQNQERDETFRKKYWLGGEEGSVLDLTLTERRGVKFDFHAGVMCSRAAYSMAMSYLGLDVTPGDMSAMMNSRNLTEPYDMISWSIGVERVTADAYVFNTMVENYLTDDSYSPVYLYFRRPNGTCHSVLVIAKNPETGRFWVVDSNPMQSRGELYRVYFISLNKNRTEIINSSFKKELIGSQILQIYQWRLIEDEMPVESAE